MTALDDGPSVVRLEWVPSHRGEVATSRCKWADRPPGWFAVRVPLAWRGAHEAYALLARRFWIPCPVCLRMFGGHEWADAHRRGPWGAASHPATIPIPEAERVGDQLGAAICPRCTVMGCGRMAWEPVGAELVAAMAAGSRLATHQEIDDHRRPPHVETAEDLDDEEPGYTT